MAGREDLDALQRQLTLLGATPKHDTAGVVLPVDDVLRVQVEAALGNLHQQRDDGREPRCTRPARGDGFGSW